MYFWNIGKLAKDLQEGNVSGKEEMKYILLISVVLVIGSHFSFFPPEPLEATAFTLESVVILLVGLMIAFGGVVATFRANAKGDNRDFIKRGMCLGLPIVVRVAVFTTLIEWIVIAIAYVISPQIFAAATHRFSFEAAGFLGEIVYWAWLARTLKRVGTGNA